MSLGSSLKLEPLGTDVSFVPVETDQVMSKRNCENHFSQLRDIEDNSSVFKLF
jgi:hypothetical protein